MREEKPVILILEDDPNLLRKLKEIFEEEKFEVLDCSNISEAMVIWSKNKSCIDVISTDTNMSSNGLKKEESDLTENGCHSGWFWLFNYVFKDTEHPFPVDKVFLLSEYINNLERYCSERKKYGYKELMLLKKKKHLINKGDPKGANNILLNIIKKELPFESK